MKNFVFERPGAHRRCWWSWFYLLYKSTPSSFSACRLTWVHIDQRCCIFSLNIRRNGLCKESKLSRGSFSSKLSDSLTDKISFIRSEVILVSRSGCHETETLVLNECHLKYSSQYTSEYYTQWKGTDTTREIAWYQTELSTLYTPFPSFPQFSPTNHKRAMCSPQSTILG